MSILKQLRDDFHRDLSANVIALRDGALNMADSNSKASRELAQIMVDKIGLPLCPVSPSGQALGSTFATYIRRFLDVSFAQQLSHARPGPWVLSTAQQGIGNFEQYRHLNELAALIENHPEIKAALASDYLITPDITITRTPLSDAAINQVSPYLDSGEQIAKLTPLREGNLSTFPSILHASISCKWTMRSDRSQNTRTEALNLIRNRKGNTPKIVVVTIEPLPSRLASIALGTGDVDCTYHAALYELIAAAKETGRDDQEETLNDLVVGRRLRDISDLPLDLAI